MIKTPSYRIEILCNYKNKILRFEDKYAYASHQLKFFITR